jgi:isopenicillin-N epimerase
VRDGFLLDRNVVYLNHGGYGACSAPVFEEYQRWQSALERQPTDFLLRKLSPWFWETTATPRLLDDARASLADFLGAQAADLVFMPNATSGLNAVIRSLRIRPEEEVLTTGHEYGAILRAWKFVRANVVVCEPDELVSQIGLRTRAILVSHITSPTALVLPVAEICAAARKAGVLSIVDGAHVPGHIPLDLETLGADIYVGNCHKWLCAPKGSGFLWARADHQEWIEPLVISWGYHEEADFAERHGWPGTHDPAAYLAVPRAIEAHATFDLGASAALADEAQSRLSALGLHVVAGTHAPFMRVVELPRGNPHALWRRLYEEHRIEVPVYEWEGRRLLRVSIGPYNDEPDIDRLVSALSVLL